MAKYVSLSSAAKSIGVHSATLRRWLLAGKITGIAKDRNGWWVFTAADIRRIVRWKNHCYVPNIGKGV